MTRSSGFPTALLLASVLTANASELNKDKDFKLRKAIAECLAYVALKDPKGFAELYSDSPSKERKTISYVFNGCVASRGPVLFWR
jgi:hypothetical protein